MRRTWVTLHRPRRRSIQLPALPSVRNPEPGGRHEWRPQLATASGHGCSADSVVLSLCLLRLVRRHAMHQAASATWSKTPGHKPTPASPDTIPAYPSSATAAVLYSSMETINPVAARLRSSSLANQQAAPKENRAAPATRPTVIPTIVESGEASSNTVSTDGAITRERPVPTSTIAVTMKRRFALMRIRVFLHMLIECPIGPAK